jgi:hypothetical protein
MSIFKRTALVGVYVCPSGVFAVDFKKRGSSGYELGRSFDHPDPLDDAADAADRVVSLLRTAGIQNADVAICVRGFGVTHHLLQLPPADDEVLAPIVEREVRRLEPQLGECVVSWISLPPLQSTGSEAAAQRSLLAAAAPSSLVRVFDQRLRAAGYHFLHLTALPVAMQRLVEEFEPGPAATALVAPLPDGAFLGFVLDGGLRLVIEPPTPQAEAHELPALSEEVQLGVMFVRQQFRGAQISRISLVGTRTSLFGAETVLTERLGIPVAPFAAPDLAPPAFAALGAVIDARSAKPLSLAGSSRGRSVKRAHTAVENASYAAVALVLVVAGWAVVQAARSHRASDALQAARGRLTRDSFALTPIRSTAGQRRLVQDAVGALRLVITDRIELQQALSGIAYAVRAPVRLDSLRLARASEGWSAVVGGSVAGETSARAVQSLNDLYRELPQRLAVDSLRLDHLTYADSPQTDGGSAVVKFQLSFGMPAPARKD